MTSPLGPLALRTCALERGADAQAHRAGARARRAGARARRAGALALLLGLVASCTAPPPTGLTRRGIIGGTQAPAGAYPETVALMDLTMGDPAEYFCSGTLIAPNLVLSAAHCMFDWHDNPVPASDVGIYFGDDARSVPLAKIKAVAHAFVPDSYPYGQVDDQTYGYGRDDDVSLLVLAEPVDSVTPSAILAAAEVANLVLDTPLLLVGYGMTTLDDTGPDGVKFYASSPVQMHSSYEIVIGKPGQPDTCYGDSGGPAFLEQGGARILVGITSRGTYNSTIDCGEGTINTLAPAYLDWIAQSVDSLDGGVVQRDAGPPADAAPQTDAAPATPDGGRRDGQAGDGDGGDSADAGTGGQGGGCAVRSARTPGQDAPRAGLLLGLAALLAARPRVRGRRRPRT